MSHQDYVESNLAFARAMQSEKITPCQVCGLPTIIEFGYTICDACRKIVCVTCRDGHEHNFGPPVDFQ